MVTDPVCIAPFTPFLDVTGGAVGLKIILYGAEEGIDKSVLTPERPIEVDLQLRQVIGIRDDRGQGSNSRLPYALIRRTECSERPTV